MYIWASGTEAASSHRRKQGIGINVAGGQGPARAASHMRVRIEQARFRAPGFYASREELGQDCVALKSRKHTRILSVTGKLNRIFQRGH